MSKYNIDRRLNGINPLAYMGVEPSTPPNLVQETRRPTQNDYIGYQVGTLWLVQDTEEIWFLTDKSNNVATWTLTLGDDTQFIADDGNIAKPALGILHVQGGPNIDTTAVPNLGQNIQIGLQDDIVVPGNVQFTSLANGVITTDRTGLLQSTNGLDGQVLVGGGAAPAWTTITTGDGSLTATAGANTLDLAVTPAGAVATAQFLYAPAAGGSASWGRFVAGTGIAITDVAGVLTIDNTGGGGGGGISTVHTDGADASEDLLDTSITIVGGDLIETDGAVHTVTVGLTQGNDGQVIIGATGAPAAWATMTSADGSIAFTAGANTLDFSVVGGGGGGFNGLIADDANTAAPDAGLKVTVAGTQYPNWTALTPNFIRTESTVANTLGVGLNYPFGNDIDPGDGTFLYDGNVIISSHAGAPAWTKITAGPGITVTSNTNQITITNSGGGGASGVNVFDCISGTAIPNPLTPTTIFVEGDADPLSGGYNNITTIARSLGGGVHDLIEVVLQPRLYFPSTNATGTTGVIYKNSNPFIHGIGTRNNFYGELSGNFTLTTGRATRNNGFGYHALFALTTGAFNSAFGNDSLSSLTTGSSNTAFGSDSLQSLTTGSGNTACGRQALGTMTDGSNNTAVGYFAGEAATIASSIVAIGYNSLVACTTGNYNTAVGSETLPLITTSDGNTAIGRRAGYVLTSGRNNTIVGYNAMDAATTASYNTAVGGGAISNGIATGNGYNTAVGYQSMYELTSGVSNCSYGHQALGSLTTGDYNVAIGSRTGVTTDNTASLESLTTGSNNTAVGAGALKAIVTGVDNIALGKNAGASLTGSDHDNIIIGTTGSAGDINKIRIGTAQTSCQIAGIYNRTLGATRHSVWVDNTNKLGIGYGPGEVLLVAHLDRTISNVTGDNTKFYLGNTTGTPLAPMVADTNHGGGTYVASGAGGASYTVPIAGSYLLTYFLRFNGLIAPLVIPPPPPPVFAGYDPMVIEQTGSVHNLYAFYPALKYDGYTPYQSAGFSTIAYLAAGDVLRWYIEIDYRPGESVGGAWPLSYNQKSKTIGIDSGYGTSERYSYIGVTLLEAY